MIGSSDIDKHIRKIISPILRDNGFSKVRARNNWAYREKCIWIFNIRAVGSYFSQATGFPPMSLTAMLSVFYTFIPAITKSEIKKDKDGLLLPHEYFGDMRKTLRNHNYGLQNRSGLANLREVERDDIWWVDPYGNNVEVMVNDMAESLRTVGIPWLEDRTDLQKTLLVTKNRYDCYNKFRLAMYLSKEIGNEIEFQRYKHLLEEEVKHTPHPSLFIMPE